MSNHESRKIITKTESITNKRLGHKKGFHFYSFFYGHLLLIAVCCYCCYFGPLLFLGSVFKIFFVVVEQEPNTRSATGENEKKNLVRPLNLVNNQPQPCIYWLKRYKQKTPPIFLPKNRFPCSAKTRFKSNKHRPDDLYKTFELLHFKLNINFLKISLFFCII